MEVFVTGATGFVGQALLGQLIRKNHRVAILALPDESADGFRGVDVRRGDITRTETLSGVLRGAEAVVHLAGVVGYGKSWQACRQVNVEGTRNIARAALAAGVKRFVHMSSVSVYGRVANTPISEDFPLKKIGDPYGDTKIEAEHVLQELVAGNEMAVTIIRPTVIYGPGDDKFLPKLMQNLADGRARVIGDGSNSVDLIHVHDVAHFICRILAEPKSCGRVYNLTHPDNPTWRELLREVAGAMQLPAPEKRLPFPVALGLAGAMEFVSRFTGKAPRLTRYAVRVIGRQYFYQTDRFQNELGFYPAISLREGIRDCVKQAME